jgi:hypothetical protein
MMMHVTSASTGESAMFVTCSIADTVRVPPHVFDQPLEYVLRLEIEAKYAGKVRGGERGWRNNSTRG